MASPTSPMLNAAGRDDRSQPFPHLLITSSMVYSRWEHVGVVLGGESFTRWPENLQASPYGRCGGRQTTGPTAFRPLPAP